MDGFAQVTSLASLGELPFEFNDHECGDDQEENKPMKKYRGWVVLGSCHGKLVLDHITINDNESH